MKHISNYISSTKIVNNNDIIIVYMSYKQNTQAIKSNKLHYI
jgi:hypothetical protein